MACRGALKVKAGLGQHGHRMEKVFQEIPAQKETFDTKPGLKTDCYISLPFALTLFLSSVFRAICLIFIFLRTKKPNAPFFNHTEQCCIANSTDLFTGPNFAVTGGLLAKRFEHT